MQLKFLFLTLSVSACIAAPTPGTKAEAVGSAIGATVGFGAGVVAGAGKAAKNAFDPNGPSIGATMADATSKATVDGVSIGWKLAKQGKKKLKQTFRR